MMPLASWSSVYCVNYDASWLSKFSLSRLDTINLNVAREHHTDNTGKENSMFADYNIMAHFRCPMSCYFVVILFSAVPWFYAFV